MDQPYDTRKLIVVRKLTRTISDVLRGQMKEYVTTLAPLLRPKAVLGDYVQSSTKETAKNADKAFKDLQSLFATVAAAKPFNLNPELKPPIEIISTALEMTPKEYKHMAKTERETKAVFVTSPLKWALTYSGFSHGRLRDMLAYRDRDMDAVRQHLLHHLGMHTVVSKQTGVAEILKALHFPVMSEQAPEFGQMPVTYITSSVSTVLPPDDVIIESTEISGSDAFEEVVDLQDIVQMTNPLKDKLTELATSYGEDLLPQ